VSDSRAGARGKCKCGNVILVPEVEAPPAGLLEADVAQTAIPQDMDVTEFKGLRTSDADEATRALFEEALHNLPPQSPKWIEVAYQVIAPKWGSTQLYEGGEEEMRQGVLENLRRIGSEPGFDDFMVYVVSDPTIPGRLKSIQVNAFFRSAGAFVPVRVWKGAYSFYACGNSLFEIQAVSRMPGPDSAS